MAEARKRFTVLTWNVWFEHLEYANRVRAIFEVTRQLNPDVICFQEVLPEFIHMLKSQPSANANVSFHHFPSGMNRKLLAVEIQEDGCPPWMVGNVHLESLNNVALRKEQLQVSMNVLGAHKGNALLVGDFNFCSYRSWAEGRRLGKEGRADSSPLENEVLQKVAPDFTDLWERLRPDEKGYTFDSERNGVIRQYEQMRYDRVLARLGDGWEPTAIEMVGTDKISVSEGLPFGVYPSDHFGLFSTFEGPRGGGCE